MNYANKVGTHAITSQGVKVPMILKKYEPAFKYSSILDTAKVGDKFTIDDGSWVYTLKERGMFCHTIVTNETGFRTVDGQLVYIATAYEGWLLVDETNQASVIIPVGGHSYLKRVA